MTQTIDRIERSAEAAVPSVNHIDIGKWRAHFGAGHIRRINSVATHGENPGPEEASARLAKVVDLYAGTRTRPIVRQTSRDKWMDPLLDGWAESGPTLVMTTDPRRYKPTRTISDDAWINWSKQRSSSPERANAAYTSLRSLRHPHVTCAAGVDDHVVAVGRGVLVDGLVGLYDIQTDPAVRRNGYGRRITEGLIAWASQRSAESVYLQVSAVNTPALALYRSLGFREVYRYKYRTLLNLSNDADGFASHPASRVDRTG